MARRPCSSRLISIIRVLALVTYFFFLVKLLDIFTNYTLEKTYFSKSFPLILNFRWLTCPLLADYFRDFGIGKTRVESDNLGLIMLPVKDESCIYVLIGNSKQERNIITKKMADHVTGRSTLHKG
jgi:hypothetical protein